MKKLLSISSMLLVMALMVSLTSSASAQNITLDWGGSTLTSSSTTFTPYAAFWSQTRHQYLIRKEDILATGLTPTGPVGITALSFYITATVGAGHQNWTLKMKNTTAVDASTFDNVGLQQVTTPVNMTPALVTTVPGWYKHTFSAPFIWDGVSNILVDVCHDNGNNNYTSSWTVRYGTPVVAGTTYRYVGYYSDSMTGAMCNTTTTVLSTPYNMMPNMQLEACSNSGTTTTFAPDAIATVPGSFNIDWSIYHPTQSFTSSVEFQLYTPGGVAVGAPQSQTGINVVAGVLKSGTFVFNANSFTPGFYRIEARFTELNVCGMLQTFKYSKTICLMAPGTTLCRVWPGDANNDGVVNYGDRKTLNTYIYDANLRTSWLQGPARYRADLSTNPLTYLTWEEQAGLPWNTDQGCYVDCDGNGVVNNFDYIGIKLNWMRSHAMGKGEAADFGFTMDQNFPNPFNPSTKISYSVPEPSNVRLVVMDMTGRTVATLVDGVTETGVHDVTFDASTLPSGIYMAKVSMLGNESGLTFSKTIKMNLSK